MIKESLIQKMNYFAEEATTFITESKEPLINTINKFLAKSVISADSSR